jgi:hypothetical protein
LKRNGGPHRRVVTMRMREANGAEDNERCTTRSNSDCALFCSSRVSGGCCGPDDKTSGSKAGSRHEIDARSDCGVGAACYRCRRRGHLQGCSALPQVRLTFEISEARLVDNLTEATGRTPARPVGSRRAAPKAGMRYRRDPSLGCLLARPKRKSPPS